MTIYETQIPDQDWGQRAEADGRAYALLEQARLRCGQFRGVSTAPEEHRKLGRIHRELGLAGWCASSELAPARRLPLLAGAHEYAMQTTDEPGRVHALAAIMIEAEDAVTAALGDSPSDHMHNARMHLLWAMELVAALI
jgi:hypothetical protein